MIYIYFHINPLKNEIFYVGQGTGNRAYKKYGRSKFWKNIVNKYGYIIDIIETGLTKEEADIKEIFYINKIGRRETNEGPLVNHQIGGSSGNKGRTFTKEQRDNISKGHIDYYKNNICTVELKEKRRKISKNNYPKIKELLLNSGGRSRKVINSKGKVYNNITEAASEYNIKRTTLNCMLLGQNINKTDLEYFYNKK